LEDLPWAAEINDNRASEIRKATGMEALAGGVRGLSAALSVAGLAVAAAMPGKAKEPTAVKPRAAEC